MILTDRYSLSDVLNPHSPILSDLAHRIRCGEVFTYPTETIYGIGGRADDSFVEQTIIRIKGRGNNAPFIRIGSHLDQFSKLDLYMPEKAKLLADRFWPGNITLIVPQMQGNGYVGIRVSDHPFIKSISQYIDFPLFSTSANLSGVPYVNDPDLIFATLSSGIHFMVDAGPLPESKPSSVVKITGDNVVEILREGVVRKDEIMSCISTI
jgi:L-threonylcarbamoyladenylate synthase